jgi:hypothetical protein
MGVRTIKHKVISNPTVDGVSCTDAMTEFAALKGYTDANTKVEFKNNELVVTLPCDKKQDCVVNSTPNIVCDDITGVKTSVYTITTTPVNGGKSCNDTIKSYIPSTTLSSDINVNLETKLITVKGTCDKKTTVSAPPSPTTPSTTTPSASEPETSNTTKYIIIGVAIFIFIVLIIVAFILLNKKKTIEIPTPTSQFINNFMN